jgi:hypothetical protein
MQEVDRVEWRFLEDQSVANAVARLVQQSPTKLCVSHTAPPNFSTKSHAHQTSDENDDKNKYHEDDHHVKLFLFDCIIEFNKFNSRDQSFHPLS